MKDEMRAMDLGSHTSFYSNIGAVAGQATASAAHTSCSNLMQTRIFAPLHRAIEFEKFLTKIDADVPDGLDIRPGLRQLQHPHACDHLIWPHFGRCSA